MKQFDFLLIFRSLLCRDLSSRAFKEWCAFCEWNAQLSNTDFDKAVRHAIMGEVERARMALGKMSSLIDIFYDSNIPTIFGDNFEDFYCAVVTLAKTRLYEKIDKEYK